MKGRNTIISSYHYRVDTEFVKGVCVILCITCACPACVAQLDKYLLPTIAPSPQPRYAHVENCYHNKILKNDNNWIIKKFLDNKTTYVDFDSIHALIIAGISNNKS